MKSKHIEFTELNEQRILSLHGRTRLTKIWEIVNVRTRDSLGYIEWFFNWRRYVFAPNSGMIFEKDCLRTIADFCEEKTKEHNDSKRN